MELRNFKWFCSRLTSRDLDDTDLVARYTVNRLLLRKNKEPRIYIRLDSVDYDLVFRCPVLLLHDCGLLVIAVNQTVSLGVKRITIDVGGLGFDSQAGQSGHSVANDLPLPQRFFEAVLPRR